MQFLVVLARLDAERVEVGVQMAAHPVGADHHQRMHRIARRRLKLLGRGRGLGRGRSGLALDLVAQRLFDRGPVAVQRRDQVVARHHGPVRPLPRWAGRHLAGQRFQIGGIGAREGGQVGSAVEIAIHSINLWRFNPR